MARRFGIAFDLAAALRPVYARLGHALPDQNGAAAQGGSGWVLPVPATYVVDPAGVVRLAFVDTNYRNRLEPKAVLAALDSLGRPCSAAA